MTPLEKALTEAAERSRTDPRYVYVFVTDDRDDLVVGFSKDRPRGFYPAAKFVRGQKMEA